jgi:hypothetical protein
MNVSDKPLAKAFRFEKVESPRSSCGAGCSDPPNADEPVDPFYEFLAEK